MFGVAGNMFIPMVIGQRRHGQVTAGLKAIGNTGGADGFGYPAIGDSLNTKVCMVIDSKFEVPELSGTSLFDLLKFFFGIMLAAYIR